MNNQLRARSGLDTGIWLLRDAHERLHPAYFVEKVGPSGLLAHWLLKMPFLRVATRSLNPEASAQNKEINLKRLLFCRGNPSHRPVESTVDCSPSNPMQTTD